MYPLPDAPCGVCLAPADALTFSPLGLTEFANRGGAESLAVRLRAVGWPDEVTREHMARALFPDEGPWPPHVPCGHRMLHHLLEHLSFLEGRLGIRVQETTPEARDELFRFIVSWYWMDFQKATPLPRRVYNEVGYQLATLRDRIRETKEFTDADHEVFDRCVTCLANSEDPWLVTRKLLEFLRAAPKPTLGSDLRYWGDRRITQWPSEGPPTEEDSELQQDEPEAKARDEEFQRKLGENPVEAWRTLIHTTDSAPRHNWSSIPKELGFTLHEMLGKAQLKDEQLEEFRSQFVEYLIDRLKPGKDFEPDKHWRVGYIRAAEALRINPNGKQKVLFHVKEKDPAPEVRLEAQRLYSVLRNGPKLDASPRRACFDAVWELFRAHMLALGETIDETAAAKTRREMIRRTTRSHHERTPKSD